MQEDPFREKDHGINRISNAMTITVWLVVLGLGTLYFDRFLDREHNPNQNVQTTQASNTKEILLQRNRQGHYVSNGKINGSRVRFLLDTGATDVSIPEKVANVLHLQRGLELKAHTANGTITVHLTMLDRIQIGDIVLQDVRASINPYMSGEEILLGMSFLRHLEFTQRDDQLILKQYN